MPIDDEIKDEKIKYDINREAAKMSAFLSRNIDKYEYLTGEDILPQQNNRTSQVYIFSTRSSI